MKKFSNVSLILSFMVVCLLDNLVSCFVSHHYHHQNLILSKSQSIGTEKSLPLLWSTTPNTSNENDENKKLLEKARLLREEALKLEQQLREKPKKVNESSSTIANTVTTTPAMVTKLPDSIWTFSYRFSSQPKDDNNNNNNNNNSDGNAPVLLPNYSGKATIRLLGDGYSELISQSEDSKIVIKKVWGWDEEYSREDEKQYLLFSMDVQFPDGDPKLPGKSERYYFQARVDRTTTKTTNDNSNVSKIELQDGTITVKKDVAEKTKGRWGLFQVAGILSEFRYVGEFIAKPAASDASS